MNKIMTLLVIIGGMMMTSTVAKAKPFNPETEAISLIAKYEGFHATVYTCPGGCKTIGYGFTDATLVTKKSITIAEADKFLGQRVRQEIKWVKTTFPKLSDRQIVAIVSLAYNIGHDRILWKTVNGKKVHTNAYNALIKGDYKLAASEISEFRMANGKVLKGLVKRRAAEVKYLCA